MAMRMRFLFIVFFASFSAGCAEPAPEPQMQPKPDSLVFDGESHDRVFNEAVELLWPYIQLHGDDPKDATTEEGSEQIHEGIEKLNAIIRFNPTNWVPTGLPEKLTEPSKTTRRHTPPSALHTH